MAKDRKNLSETKCIFWMCPLLLIWPQWVLDVFKECYQRKWKGVKVQTRVLDKYQALDKHGQNLLP